MEFQIQRNVLPHKAVVLINARYYPVVLGTMCEVVSELHPFQR